MMNNIKRVIGLHVLNSKRFAAFNKCLININLFLFHFPDRQHHVYGGDEDADKTYYVIRPRSKDEGLISSYFYVAREVMDAKQKGYIPLVDFENFPCQYTVARKVNGTNNAWEYYFNQPEIENINTIKKKKNIILSGWQIKENKETFINKYSNLYSSEISAFCKEYLPINKTVDQILENKYSELFNGKQTLGVFIRGTDYTDLKPKGHWKQPEIKEFIIKIKEFLDKYPIERVFVVTEDYNYYKAICENISCEAFSSDSSFVKDYKKGDYISNSFENDPYQRGLDYLIRLLLLGRCDYLISSLATGSFFANYMKKSNYKAEYWFNIGKY